MEIRWTVNSDTTLETLELISLLEELYWATDNDATLETSLMEFCWTTMTQRWRLVGGDLLDSRQ